MLSTGVFTLAVAAAALFSTADAHGKMTKPLSRGVSEKYHKDSGALINIGASELQIAPIESLSQHKQADFPPSATFNIMNGCRGTTYEEGNNVTTLAPVADFDVKWTIQAPHPGYMKLSILKPSEDSTGTITYKSYKTLLNIEPFANSGGDDGTTAKMPADVSGCEKPGDCVLQFYWHSENADQTYPTCSDIVVSGSAVSTPSTPTAASDASGAAEKTTDAPATPVSTDAPAAPVSTPKSTTAAPKATTAAPAATPVPASKGQTEVGGESDGAGQCSRRMRRN